MVFNRVFVHLPLPPLPPLLPLLSILAVSAVFITLSGAKTSIVALLLEAAVGGVWGAIVSLLTFREGDEEK